MDDWEDFNKLSSPKKQDFCSQLHMGDIIVADQTDKKRVSKDFKTKDLNEYHELIFQSNNLFLADVF